MGGDADTPFQTSWDVCCGDGFDVGKDGGATASWRVVYDTGDWDACRSALPVGISEKMGARHYLSSLPAWQGEELKPMYWSRAAVRAAATVRVQLTPPGPDDLPAADAASWCAVQ